jgi:hypothetical protein
LNSEFRVQNSEIDHDDKSSLPARIDKKPATPAAAAEHILPVPAASPEMAASIGRKHSDVAGRRQMVGATGIEPVTPTMSR